VALSPESVPLADLDALGETDGYVFEEIGECLLALGRTTEAQPHFASAVELLAGDPPLADDPERFERVRSLARAGDQTEP
jgi:hypothetical protein